MTYELQSSDGRIHLNLAQARKIADYANRADWHISRGYFVSGLRYVGLISEVLAGVIDPGEGPASLLFPIVSEGLRSNNPDTKALRDASINALEKLESELYTPIKRAHG